MVDQQLFHTNARGSSFHTCGDWSRAARFGKGAEKGCATAGDGNVVESVPASIGHSAILLVVVTELLDTVPDGITHTEATEEPVI